VTALKNMIKNITAAILTGAVVLSCGGGQKKSLQQDFIDLYLEQDGRIINIIDDTAMINRKQFRFVFSFRQPDGILLNASFEPASYESAASGTPVENIPGFSNTGIAEEPFNPEYQMFISNDSPNYWYYADETDSRFDSVTKDETGFKCRRTISSFIELQGKAEKKEISKLKHDTIYIVISMIEWNDDFTKMIERSRRYFKIKFIP